MTAAIRSPTTPNAKFEYPAAAAASTGNLKNIYQEALNEHRSNSNHNINTYEGTRDSNLKHIYSEAAQAAANPSRVDRTTNMKQIINEAAITNSLAEKIAASTQVVGPNYSTQQPVYQSGGSGGVSQYSATSSKQQMVSVESSSSSTMIQQHHHHYHSTSSSSTNSPYIGRPPINNQITIPVDSGNDRRSNLVNIMTDVIATNNSAYQAYPNRFAFTGPNSNLKGIVAEATDYNARMAPTNQNMYHNLRDSNMNMNPADMNQSNILGENRGFGMARVTVHYDQLRSRFSVTVHEARYLKNLDKKSVSDPYARVYLAPDSKPSYKRKTRIIKNNLNPVWQETFDYPMTLNEALSKVLTVNLKDERGFFEKQEGQFLGEVRKNLFNF